MKIGEEKTKEIRIVIPEDLLTIFIPKKMLQHLLNAKKEFLLALRSLIDAKIEASEKKEGKRPVRKKKINTE